MYLLGHLPVILSISISWSKLDQRKIVPTPICHHDLPAKRNSGQCNKCDDLNDTQGPQHGQPALMAVETQTGSGPRALQGAAPQQLTALDSISDGHCCALTACCTVCLALVTVPVGTPCLGPFCWDREPKGSHRQLQKVCKGRRAPVVPVGFDLEIWLGGGCII